MKPLRSLLVQSAVAGMLAVLPQYAAAQLATVSPDHPVYPLLFKGEALGCFSSYQLRTLPITRNEARQLLAAMKENADRLSSADAALVARLLEEFTDPEFGRPASEEHGRHLIRYEEGASRFFVNGQFVQRFEFLRGRIGIRNENVSETIVGGSVRGAIGQHVFFGLTARNGFTAGAADTEERFDPDRGPVQVGVAGGTFSDQATGIVALELGPFQMRFGREYLAWGSSQEGQLGLEAGSDPFDQVQFSLTYERFRFSFVHAALTGIRSGRYLAGHRLDVLLGSSLQLGAYETVVYAGRGVELAYLNPFVPYHIIEHQLGDLDNNMLGVDAAVVPAAGVRLHADLFIDDLSLDHPIDSFWGNKLAYKAGLHWAAPLGWKTLEVLLAYTRVDPFVFTHHDSSNVYAHYGRSIGFSGGPNTDRTEIILLARPMRELTGMLRYVQGRRGRGDILTPHRAEDGEGKDFLTGTVERRRSVGLSLQVEFLRRMFARVNAEWTHGSDIGRVAGSSSNELSLHLAVEINY